MRNINVQIKNATKWSTTAEMLARIITPIINMVLARVLTPEAFGVVATITMVTSFAEIFTDAGFQRYIIQHEFEDSDALDKSTNVAFWTNLCTSGLFCVGIFLFRHKIAVIVGSEGYGNAISIASGMILLTAFSSIQMARFKRDFDFKTLFFVRITTAVIPLVVTVPLAFWLKNYWALLIGNLVGKLFHAVALTVRSSWRPGGYFNFQLLKKMLSYSLWILVGSIAVWLTEYIGIFVVGHYLEDYYLGLYRTSMTTVNSYMAIITASVVPVLFSSLSRCQNNEFLFRDIFYRFQRMTAVLAFPMGVGVWLFDDLVTLILFGKQWAEAAPFIGLWGLTSTIAIVFSQLSNEVYRSKGKPWIAVVTQMIHIAVVALALVLVRNESFETIYTVRSLIRIQGFLVTLICMQFLFGFKVLDTFKNVWPTVCSAAIMGVFGWLLKPVFDSILWQFVVIAMCVVVYFAVLFVLFPRMREEILSSDALVKARKKVFK